LDGGQSQQTVCSFVGTLNILEPVPMQVGNLAYATKANQGSLRLIGGSVITGCQAHSTHGIPERALNII